MALRIGEDILEAGYIIDRFAVADEKETNWHLRQDGDLNGGCISANRCVRITSQ